MISDGQEKPSSSDVKAVDASEVEVEVKATFHHQPSAIETTEVDAEVSGDASLSFSVLNDYNDSCLSLNLTDELADGVNHSILAAQNFDDNHFSDYWATEQKELEKLKHQLDVYNAEKNRLSADESKKRGVDKSKAIFKGINEQNEKAEIRFKWNFPPASQKRAIMWIRDELKRSTSYLDAAKRIKRAFDNKFGGEWTCSLMANAKERSSVFSHHRDTISVLEILFPQSGLRIALFKQRARNSKDLTKEMVLFFALLLGVIAVFIVAVMVCAIVRDNERVYEARVKQLDSALKREIAARQAVDNRFANWDNKLRKELVARHEAVEIVEMLTTLRQREKTLNAELAKSVETLKNVRKANEEAMRNVTDQFDRKKKELTNEKETAAKKLKEIEAKLEKLGEGFNYRGDEAVLIAEGQLPKSMQQDAIVFATEALKKFNNSDEYMKSVANQIQTEFEKKYGPIWNCVVVSAKKAVAGRDFGWSISYKRSRLFSFWHGKVHVTLFKPIVEEPSTLTRIATEFFEFVDKWLSKAA